MQPRVTVEAADPDGLDALAAYLHADHAELDWQARAACADADPATFFPERGVTTVDEARAICAACPVRVECLQWALDLGIDHGVWGGTSERQRRQARRRGLDATGLLAELERPRRVVRSSIQHERRIGETNGRSRLTQGGAGPSPPDGGNTAALRGVSH